MTQRAEIERLVVDAHWLRTYVRTAMGACYPLGAAPERQKRIDRIADALSGLIKRGEALREALEPWARVARLNMPLAADWSDDRPARSSIPGAWPTWGDLKRADAALSNTAE